MNVIETKSFEFAVEVIEAAKEVRKTHKEYDLTSQFVRSGTSVGANVCEAIKAQSRKDFIAKMSIASKEANEVNYWIRLLKRTGYISEGQGEKLLRLSDELIRILTSIVKSSQEGNSKLKIQNS